MMMEEATPSTASFLGFAGISDVVEDLVLMDDLLAHCSDFSDMLQPDAYPSPFGSSNFDILGENSHPLLVAQGKKAGAERSTPSANATSMTPASPLISSKSALFHSLDPTVAMKDRLLLVLNYIKEAQKDGDILVQIWAPITSGDKRCLTTVGQPFVINSNCKSLQTYRTISTGYNFSADECVNDAKGLPGRVFLGKVPEWTPDVRYFTRQEYPRVDYARRYEICGSIGLPIFERTSSSCLGVVELVMTNQKINYSSEIDSICNALQAVDLRSCEVLTVPKINLKGDIHQIALPEIRRVLKGVCDAHNLPLAQTWVPCIQQGKKGSRHSDEKYGSCMSTVDSACYVRDPRMLRFQQACSEHHLYQGEGVAGKAYITNEPSFSSDISSLCKMDYPLSHHARLFSLKGAVAVRLRSIHTGNVDFVLEFFLPVDCEDSDTQKVLLNSLSITLQKLCVTLRVVTADELEDHGILTSKTEQLNTLPAKEPSHETLLWMPDASEQRPCYPSEGFYVTTGPDLPDAVLPACRISSHSKQKQEDVGLAAIAEYYSFSHSEKRPAKTEKSVSLDDLRKHFAGSLKDAAKNLGVCPTTLKRICRQYGITRWPSRKIKKVGRSLKKLQMVIDSVHGPDGPVQLSSLYETYTKAAWSDKEAPKSTASFSEKTRREQISGSNSLSSSSCSRSSTSSAGCSSKLKRQHCSAPQFVIKPEIAAENVQIRVPVVEHNKKAQLHAACENNNRVLIRSSNAFKIKAIHGEEKFIFRLQPTWGFQDLKGHLLKRFNIIDESPVALKYLDDESEWILLTCDADLQECFEVHESSSAHSIKISVHQSSS